MINQNDMAKAITLKEGKKRSVSIAQVKEIMKLTFEYLANHSEDEVLKLIDKYS